jgi:thermitase
MKRKMVSAMMLTLLLISMLTLAINIQPVSSELSLPIESSVRARQTLTEGEPNSTVRDKGNLNGINERSEFNGDDRCSTQLVIGISNGKSDAYTRLMGIIAKHGCEVVNTVSIAGEIIAVVVNVSSAEAPSLTREMSADGLSSYIEHRMKFQSQIVPNDPYWSLQWGPQKIEADWAWNTTIGDPSVLVAVIDTGIDWDHPDLAANYVALGYDWVNNDTDPMDDNGHGTHCAGIIAAVINNSIGVAGLAQVRIMAEKGLNQYGQGYEDDLANAIIHAVDQGAGILSNSWGSYGESALIHDAVKYAYDSGVLVVAAAGNEATSNKLYPAAYDEVVAVTATDAYDNPAYFTNFGEWVELAAPGVDIYSTYWDNTYRSMSGTSMATPHVAGVAALVWSQFPNMTRDWVRAQLRYAADDLGDPGFDDYYGYGRINARKAVEQAPPDHDLLIFDWERPLLVKLGELATFNTTVLNFGISDETNVEVQLLVSSSLIDSTSIAFLPGGGSTTVGLSWTPTVEGTYNVTSYVVPVPEETITQNNLITEIITVVAPPPEANWILLATDPDEGVGTSLKAIYGQLYSDIIYFKVEHYRPWTTINDIDTAIFIDADQDPSTGLPDGFYPGQNTGIGADYVIVVGLQATKMWKWDPIAEGWDIGNPISLAYLDAPDGSNVFVVGVYLASVETGGILDCAVGDVVSGWDWMPDAGYFTWILIRYEHELTVFLEAPLCLQPGETSLLNATVYNAGLNNETNVELQLLINDTIVNNATIPELVNGTSYTIDYLWTATVEGIYNLTAYAPPVPGENVTANNMMSLFVNVQYLEVALFKNVDPWDYPANEEALSLYGIAYAVFSSSDFGLVDLSSFSKVVIASDQDQIFYNAMDAYRWWFEDYVSSGGVLEIHAADWGWHGGLWVGTLPGGLGWAHYASNYVTIVDPTHPVVTTPNPITDAELDGWSASVHGYFSTYPAYSHIVITEDSTGYPAYLKFDYGSGFIVASSQTLEWAYMHGYSLILENSLLYSPIKYSHELAVTLETPTLLEPVESTLLNATVINRGLNNETNVELFLLINGTEVNSTAISELLSGSSYTLSYLWTPTVEGTYNVTAFAPPVPDENVTANNVKSVIVLVQVLPDILIVNDDDGSSLIHGTSLPEFESALAAVGYDYWVWNESSMGNPPLEFLVKFRLVIWTCGDYWNRAVDTADAITLQSYLAQGGNILLEGEDIGYDHDADEFMVNVAHAIMQVDGTGAPGLTVTDPTHPVTFGLPNSFAWLINPPYDDGVSPTNGGAEVIKYTGTTWTAVTVFEGASTGSVVYYAFPLYCLAQSHGETLTINSVNWLLAPTVPPVANFTWTPPIPKVGESVTFDASASTPNGGTIVKYEWNFSDGGTATGKIVTHTYVNPGTYIVTLNVTDSQGLWDIEQKQIQVVQPHGPEAKFTATPETAKVGELVKFDASSSLSGWNGTHNMPIIEYRWDFGDGNTTTTSTPIIYHSYKTAGNYYVTLTVYAPGATPETDTITYRVKVVSVPVGGYSIPMERHTTAKPLFTYIALIAILTAIFTKLRPKTKRKR